MTTPAYVPPSPRATTALLALYVGVGVACLEVAALVRRIIVTGRLRDGRALVDELLGADQLVNLATVLTLVAGVVVAVLLLRWSVAVHRNATVLGVAPRSTALRWCAAAWLLALVAVLIAFFGPGAAADVDDRQRIDVLRIIATVLTMTALGTTIAAVHLVTAAQARDAAIGGADPPQPAPAGGEAGVQSGLTVVSEEQARQGSDRL